MKRYQIVLGAVMLTCSAWVASAADVDGVLMDKMCSMKAMKDGQSAAAMHTKECALMPDCQKSGYGVFTADGRYLKFDAAGDEKGRRRTSENHKEGQPEGEGVWKGRGRHHQSHEGQHTIDPDRHELEGAIGFSLCVPSVGSILPAGGGFSFCRRLVRYRW